MVFSVKLQKFLNRKEVSASVWVLGGNIAGQALRLVSNLILTRLLFPEAFGLMALVQVVIAGVMLLTDIGFKGAVFVEKNSDDPRFLNTIWTLQILRGVLICCVIWIVAWPASNFYGQPDLLYLLMAVGVSSIISGFNSTAIYTLQKDVKVARLTIMEVSCQALSVVLMIALAVQWRSVWVLTVGYFLGSALRLIWSHLFLTRRPHSFSLVRSYAKSIVRYGRWIIPSTALGFVLLQGDRIIVGKILTIEEMGVYSIAFFISFSFVQISNQISGKVLHPIYVDLLKLDTYEFRRKLVKLRMGLMCFAIPPICFLAVFGDWVVELLYDTRYVEAGWMLRILAVGAIGQVVASSADSVMLARGDSFRYMNFKIISTIFLISGLFIGFQFGQFQGMLIGLSGARLATYVPLCLFIRRYNAWLPKYDAVVFASSASVIGIGLVLRNLFLS